MELDDLKQNWELINKRLQENEVLNKRIIKEMITKRTTSAYNKLLNIEIISLIIMIILIPTFLIISQTVKYPPALPWIVSLAILAIFITIWIIIKIHWLKKFNIEQKDIYQLARIIQTYRSWILKENYILVPLFMIFLIVRFVVVHAQNIPWFATLIISVIIFLPLCGFANYHFFYKKQFNNIQKSLRELNEFKE